MPVITGVGFYSVRGGFGGEPERVVGTVQNLRGPGQVLGTAAGDTLTALGLVLGSFLVFAFLRTLFGRTWLAGALVIASTGAVAFLGTPWSEVLRLALLIAIIISILARFGLLPHGDRRIRGARSGPGSHDHRALRLVRQFDVDGNCPGAALAVWSFRVALGGRKVLTGEFMDG